MESSQTIGKRMTSFGEAISLFCRNYVNFEGRASRAEYWWPTLLQVGVYIVLFLSFIFFLGAGDYNTSEGSDDFGSGAFSILIAGFLFALINFLPGLAVKVRRFHDLDQSGWLVLVFWGGNFFIPLVEFARMIWFAFPGIDGPNQYGPDPFWNEAEIFG